MKKPKTKFMARQGDVLIEEIDERPQGDWKEAPRDDRGRVILAAGEVTGHHHAIHSPSVCLLRAEGVSDAVMTVGRELAELVHEEHGTIPIPPGQHRVRIQREWGGELSRRVED